MFVKFSTCIITKAITVHQQSEYVALWHHWLGSEGAIPLLKKKPGMGAKEVKVDLENKYKIKIHIGQYGMADRGQHTNYLVNGPLIGCTDSRQRLS
jgi:hypothetical protein